MAYKFGDMVHMRHEGGIYMIVAPYTGERYVRDEQGPAVWIVDINTQYMIDGDGSTTWTIEDNLEPIDE